jgi:hypothetical protein
MCILIICRRARQVGFHVDRSCRTRASIANNPQTIWHTRRSTALSTSNRRSEPTRGFFLPFFFLFFFLTEPVRRQPHQTASDLQRLKSAPQPTTANSKTQQGTLYKRMEEESGKTMCYVRREVGEARGTDRTLSHAHPQDRPGIFTHTTWTLSDPTPTFFGSPEVCCRGCFVSGTYPFKCHCNSYIYFQVRANQPVRLQQQSFMVDRSSPLFLTPASSTAG